MNDDDRNQLIKMVEDGLENHPALHGRFLSLDLGPLFIAGPDGLPDCCSAVNFEIVNDYAMKKRQLEAIKNGTSLEGI